MHFRAQVSAAPLKLSSLSLSLITTLAFPRSGERGPVEAGGRVGGICPIEDFRAQVSAAPLKLTIRFLRCVLGHISALR